MKKISLSLAIAVMAILATLFTVPQVLAYTGTNIYDDSGLTVTTSGDNVLIQNSITISGSTEYTLVFNWDHDQLYQYLTDPMNYQNGSIEFAVESHNESETDYDGILYFDNLEDFTAFVQTSADTVTEFTSVGSHTELDFTITLPSAAYQAAEFTEANVFLYEGDEVDTVDPVISYTSAQVYTPYNDLITLAEIQAGVTATDNTDGDITSSVTIYSDTYTGVATKVVGGNYHIVFEAVDAAGNEAYLDIKINVIDNIKPYLNYNSTTYQNGASITLPSWYDDSGAAAKLTLDEIKALFTYADGYYSSASLVVAASCGTANYYDVPGTYAIALTVTDGSSNVSTYTVNVTVLQNADPVISGSASQTIEITSFSMPSLLALYSATDAEDGSLSVAIDSSTTWNYATPALGTFTLVLRATDSLGAYTTKTVSVVLRDSTAPVFKINNIAVTNYSVTVNMSNTTTLQTLIDSIVVIDSWYGTLTSSKVVPTLPSLTTPATTSVTITCTDGSGNVGSLVLTITVADDVLPIISGPTKVVKGQTVTLPLSEITAQLTATDNVSGTLSVVVVSDGYTGHASTIGSYLVQYSATDTAGNTKYWDVRVWVLDDIPPVWGFDDTFFEISAGTVMTRTELVNLLSAAGIIGQQTSYTVTFLTDEYSGNEEIAGVYEVTMNIVYQDGSESQVTLELTVPEQEDEGDVIVVDPEPEEEAHTGLVQWLINAWAKIKNAGVWVWTKICLPVANAGVWIYDHILLPAWNFVFVKADVTTTTVPPVSSTTTTTTTASGSTSSTTTASGLIDLGLKVNGSGSLLPEKLPPAEPGTLINAG